MGLGEYVQFRKWNRDKTFDKTILATDSTATLAAIVSPKSANHQLYIQRIFFAPTTYAAQTLVFQDESGTPQKIGEMAISAAAPTTGGNTDEYILDFGAKGVALGIGQPLDIVLTAGPAGQLHVECYDKLRTDQGVQLSSAN